MASSLGKMPTTVSAALDLAIDPFERTGGVRLGAVLGRDGHVGEHASLRLVEEGCELRQLGAQLISDVRIPTKAPGYNA